MTEAAIVIPNAEHWPSLHVHVNPVSALYHYLASEAQKPQDQRDPATADAAALMKRARTPSLLHGVWGRWEEPLAESRTIDDAALGLRDAMIETIELLTDAMRQVEPVFMESLWSERIPLVDAALATLREHLVPHFPTMASRQARFLDLAWPPEVDAFLVPDCHAWQGGYSQPFTVGVSKNLGLELCETIVHEATHVADGHTMQIDRSPRDSLKDRLVSHLRQHRVPSRTAWDAWHAVIFASSAEQIRFVIQPSYQDYALTHNSPESNLYMWFKLPDLPAMWSEFTAERMNEAALFESLTKALSA